ncbi:hypothetical protein D3C80_809040 [compost metagenome]
MEGADVANLVRLNHCKGRTFYCALVPKATNNASRQGGLAGPQVPFEKNHAVTLGHFGNAVAEVDHGLFIGQKQGYARHAECSSNN